MSAAADLVKRVEAHLLSQTGSLIDLRRHLHAHPELSHEEFRTTEFLVERLEALGLDVHVRPEGTGFYADVTPDGFDPETMPTIAMRCDIDGLPIVEQTGAEYASTNEGVMHACGHDVHMTIATGVGVTMNEYKDELPGRLRLIYQHAEEGLPGGASEMVEFGTMDTVEAVIALHVDPELPVGQIGVRWGAFTAGCDAFTLKVIGKSGHGARPHHCVDPVFVTAQLLNALYPMIGRVVDARDPMVLTIGMIHGGHAENVVPDEVIFSGTVRTLSEQNRVIVEPTLRRIAQGVCDTYGARFEMEMHIGSPAIINDPDVVEVIAAEGERLLGKDNVYWIPQPSMGAEDFSFYCKEAPGAMFRLGVYSDKPQHFLHSAHFDIDERAINIGTRVLARSAYRLLEKHAAASAG